MKEKSTGDTLEVVFGNSIYYTIKKSVLGNDNILMFNVLFNVGDLSNIENFEINIPEELYYEKNNVNFKKEYDVIIDNIKKNNKIRVWTSRKHIYSYLIMLYLCSVVKEQNYELYVLYSDEYDNSCFSPSAMRENELEELSKLEHKLTRQEINDNAQAWEKLVSVNSDLRIIENGYIKSVTLDYYDEKILNTLKELGKVKMSKLVGVLMANVDLLDTLYVYLIERLIKNGKIKITLNNDIRYFDNIIEVTN